MSHLVTEPGHCTPHQAPCLSAPELLAGLGYVPQNSADDLSFKDRGTCPPTAGCHRYSAIVREPCSGGRLLSPRQVHTLRPSTRKDVDVMLIR
jgi:hypothetical protein